MKLKHTNDALHLLHVKNDSVKWESSRLQFCHVKLCSSLVLQVRIQRGRNDDGYYEVVTAVDVAQNTS